MNTTSHYLAVAYEWVLVPPEVTDFDVVLIVGSCAAVTEGLDPIRTQEPQLRVYHAKLPEKESRYALSDVSGCLGLLHPVSDEHAERKAAAFERLVSDVLLWRLAQESFPPTERTTILLQGPMLPKLRGRLMYRGIPENITFCAVTYQPDWFRRVEAAEQSYKVLREANIDGFGAVYPPRALDRGTRSWVYRSSRGFPMHFEVVTNMLDCFCSTRDWVVEIENDIKQLVSPDLPGVAHSSISPVPFPLNEANKTAKDAKEREDSFVSFLLSFRGCNYNLIELNKVPACADLLQHLNNARLRPTPGIELVLKDCVGPEKEEELYSLFKEAWSLKRSEPTETQREDGENILVLQPEAGPLFTEKDARALRDELWAGVKDLVIRRDQRKVKSYLRKVAEDALRRNGTRATDVRSIFIDRKFVMPLIGREIFNRLTGDELITRIAEKTGIQP